MAREMKAADATTSVQVPIGDGGKYRLANAVPDGLTGM
jgi:hypothetical protein